MCLSTYIYTITAETLKKEYNDDDDDDDDDSFPYISFSYTTTLRFPCVISVVSCFVLFFLLLLLAMIKSTRNNVFPLSLILSSIHSSSSSRWEMKHSAGAHLHRYVYTDGKPKKQHVYVYIIFSHSISPLVY